MNFHDDLHPPDPNQRQICKKKYGLNHFRTCLGGGRAMRASEFVSMTLIGVRGNAWKKHCPPLRGLSTQIDIDWGQGERIKKKWILKKMNFQKMNFQKN